ncbi:MAG: hypothetical protein KKF50_03985 [Nanoarchaeota archaeon]|nr:hypothetical protein [Nanoarchaeota archaeon]
MVENKQYTIIGQVYGDIGSAYKSLALGHINLANNSERQARRLFDESSQEAEINLAIREDVEKSLGTLIQHINKVEEAQ